MSTQHDFGEFLKRKGISYETVPDGDKTVYKISEYEIPFGRYARNIVGIGIPIPRDFPNAAPYGLHVKANAVYTETIPAGDKLSLLGPEWKFWSRNVNNWNDPRNRNCQYYFDHVNRWLEVN
jgi:hypothetical protein